MTRTFKPESGSLAARALAIPDAWLMGYLHGHPGQTVADAVAYWQEQDRMSKDIAKRIRARLKGSGLYPELGR